jgi:ABC-2 type transport system permease protein
LTAYAVMAFGPAFGVEHNLLIYGSDPGWTYSDMRGFDPFMGPWRWFKLYWTAWGLLLTVAAVLLSVRGREEGLRARLGLARRRMTRPVAAVAAAALALILAAGGFVFYNTNMLNAYSSSSDAVLSRVEYERRFGQYRDVPQPQLTDIKLHVEIHPRWRMADIRGTFSLVNKGASVIDFIHLTTKSAVDTTNVRFDRSARTVVSDASLGHRIYALDTPLVPGDTLRLVFDVRFEPRGFPNRGIDASVAANGTYFTNDAWLPAIGYQSDRELRSPGVRRAHGLADRPVVPSLTDTAARHDAARGSRVAVEAVVGTDEGQIAVAPGRLRQTWTKDGRRYFQYATDVPIRNDFAFYSAAYAVREGRWNDVSIQILHDPRHAWNVDRLIRSVQASLDYYTKTFGPYPHDQIRFVEHPGDGVVLHAAPINVSYEESFSLLNPDADVRNIDLPFAVAAHEVAHQWWGNMLVPAEVEGAGLLTETLAWYSAMGVVKQAYGAEHLRRLLDMMREVYVTPRTMANVPLLRATDRFLAYRKGPFAIYALSEYIGAEQVNGALKRLVERYGSGAPPLATSLDLYRELQAVTPTELKPLLADLFEANTYWELAADRATAEPTGTGAWQVTLDVRARKVVVDTTGVETERPMDDVAEVGIFGPAEAGETDKPLYLRTHRLRSGAQRITVRVPRQPTRAGIDPRRLLIDVRGDDNVRGIAIR